MNLVFLIGNGFDLKLGLKTRYSDFYQWYKKLEPHPNPIVQSFRNEIDSNHPQWSDLESALGVYLKKVENKKDGVAIHNDLVSSLKSYIAIQNAKQITPIGEEPSFFRQFFFPYETFKAASRRRITEYINFDNTTYTRLIIFNYTTTMERLLDWNERPLIFGLDRYDRQIMDLVHIHGYCDERGRLALGVDNAEQIANKTLIEHRAIINRFVKPAYNDAYELEHHLPCYKWINEADVIFIFGLSLGKTDKTWWSAVAKRMKEQSNVLLFVHIKRDGIVTSNSGPEYQDQVEEDKEWIIERIGLENTPSIYNRIFVTYSDDCLSFKKLNALSDREKS